MSTPAQILANRRNSLHSTGPKTDAGKASSNQNAKTHGFAAIDPILAHEDRDRFNTLHHSYISTFAPADEHEEHLVHELASARWKLDRVERLELALLNPLTDPQDPTTSDAVIAQSLTEKNIGVALDRLDRYRSTLHRIYHRCLRELRTTHKQQNEANSTQMAEKKFGKLLQNMMDAPPPGYKCEPRLVPVDPETETDGS